MVKIFCGPYEKVEKAMNTWGDDGVNRVVSMMIPLNPGPNEGYVAVMVVYEDVKVGPPGPKLAVGRVVH